MCLFDNFTAFNFLRCNTTFEAYYYNTSEAINFTARMVRNDFIASGVKTGQ